MRVMMLMIWVACGETIMQRASPTNPHVASDHRVRTKNNHVHDLQFPTYLRFHHNTLHEKTFFSLLRSKSSLIFGIL